MKPVEKLANMAFLNSTYPCLKCYLTAFMLLYSATLLDIHSVQCRLVKLCHDSSVHYTLSENNTIWG